MSPADEQPAPRRPRVVIAEDEPLIRLDLVEMLTEEGYEVVAEVGDGAQAVAQADRLRPDLVVMDIKMPRVDGITAASQITDEAIAPVVMLTAFSQRELIERASLAGALGYVVKPFTASDLVPAIEVALSRFSQVKALTDEVADLHERLAARKAVDRAKSLLQEQLGISEPEAFGWIQRTAMDLRISMHELADRVVQEGLAESETGG